MDDDSCVMKLIEVVPVDNKRNCSESADVKLSPCHVKVCTQLIYYVHFVNSCITETSTSFSFFLVM